MGFRNAVHCREVMYGLTAGAKAEQEAWTARMAAHGGGEGLVAPPLPRGSGQHSYGRRLPAPPRATGTQPGARAVWAPARSRTGRKAHGHHDHGNRHGKG